MKRIGIFVERQRAWGRQLCEGIAAFAQAKAHWELATLEREDLRNPRLLDGFDGFVARVSSADVAEPLRRTGKAVADVSCEMKLDAPFARGVLQDNRAIGVLAARHFIEHRFAHFAFCGFDGKRFSDERRDAFARCLRLNHFDCLLYRSPKCALAGLDAAIAHAERLGSGPDGRRLQDWLDKLPKPVAIFCANDLRAFQVSEACKSRRLEMPKAVAILGVDNDTLVCNFTSPTLSSIDPDAFALGYSAAERLERILDGDRKFQPRKIGPREIVPRDSTEVYPLDPPWLSDALVFIRRNVNRRLSANDVYAHLRLSHTSVNRAFREKLATTVQREIRTTQLAEAKRLIRDTTLSLAEIAKRTGFATPQYFSNVFAAAFGRAPSAFRVGGNRQGRPDRS